MAATELTAPAVSSRSLVKPMDLEEGGQSKPPLVLSQDAQLIGNFNSKANDRFRVHLDVFPEPYLGNPD
jgi:hypothetical protein